MGLRPPSRTARLIAFAAAVGCITGCASAADTRTGHTPGVTSSTRDRAATIWLFSRRALRQVQVDPDVRQELTGARVFEIAGGERPTETTPGLVPTVKFASYASMRLALANGDFPRWVRAILYDNEAWSFTPTAEQRAPGHYMALAAELAHRHHLLFLASPGLDLAAALKPGATHRAAGYLELRLAALAAKVADVVDIQAQSLERSTLAYVQFVRRAAAQARLARPGVTVLAGVSSNPTGPTVSAGQLSRAMVGAAPYVDGYWMNIPSRGPLCPRCNAPRPDLAIAAIRSLSHAASIG